MATKTSITIEFKLNQLGVNLRAGDVFREIWIASRHDARNTARRWRSDLEMMGYQVSFSEMA